MKKALSILLSLLSYLLVCEAFASEIISKGDSAIDDELYNKAINFKEKEDYNAAVSILEDIISKYPNNNAYHLSYIDVSVEQLNERKISGDLSWKIRAKELGVKIKSLYYSNITNADYYYIWAKYSWVVESKRESNIDKALQKAFFYKPDHTDAHILKGDIYFEKYKNVPTSANINAFRYKKLSKIARESYESALKNRNIHNEKRAYIFYKIGDLEDLIHDEKELAITSWTKAVELAPDSKGGRLAKSRLANERLKTK